MKRTLLPLVALCALALTAVCGSCGDNAGTQGEAKKTEQKTSKGTDPSKLPNYRYVDVDTVLSQYNLSKDCQERMLSMQNNLESTLRQKQNSLQSMASKMQQKYQNNGYSSQSEFEQDQRKLANAQAAAEKSASDMQASYAKQADDMQKSVRDSITSYIKVYNEKYGYDAIFMKDAALYIDPALDITADIVKGLNERYNKVKK